MCGRTRALCEGVAQLRGASTGAYLHKRVQIRAGYTLAVLCRLKKEKTNSTYVEVGVALLERWSFPRELVVCNRQLNAACMAAFVLSCGASAARWAGG